MQKVAKERLVMFKPSKLEKPASTDLLDTGYIEFLFKKREQMLFMELGGKMMKAGKKGMFETWMYNESDLIQAAAHSYGDRLISETFHSTIANAEASLQPVLTKLFQLYQLSNVEKNLGWYLTTKTLTLEQGQQVTPLCAQLCRELAPHSLPLVEAFGITDTMLSAPIALDWVKYNVDNFEGEVENANL